MSSVLLLLIGIVASKKHLQREEASSDTDELISVPNSCLLHEDDENVIVKLLADDTAPVLNVRCSNQYMIVNLNKDEVWKAYFSSHREYHYNVIGPIKDDHVNWQQWLVPPMDDFLVSPDCLSCDDTHELNHMYSTASAYYMTPVAAGCTQLPIGRIGCDMNWYDCTCRVCETSATREPGYWASYEVYNGLNDPDTTLHFEDEIDSQSFAKYGLCGFTIRDAFAEHMYETDSFTDCKTVTHDDVLGEKILPRRKPSVGQDGRFCMCVKPETYVQYEVALAQVTEKQAEISEEEDINAEEEEELSDDEDINVIELYQSDFEDGTYRITESGKYVIMEDIIFDFKAPEGYMNGDLDTYNGANDWWPSYDQIDDYPGAGSLSNSYFLGFWAGITIECSDVILELDNHKLEMSEAFYYQQSFFVLISLTSQIFLPGQGPGFFGAHPQSGANVVIRNGELGLSSHHGIQGNFNKNVLVENIKIYDFKTHGIQFNGFDGISLKDVDIGPNRKLDLLSPYYAHMKALLPIYRIMVEKEEIAQETCVTFVSSRYPDESCVTLAELIDDVQTLLDIAFESVVLGKDYDAIDVSELASDEAEAMQRKLKIWSEGRDVMINSHESTQTATLYGVFLNYIGSNVIGWYAGSETTKSQNVLMENVLIHDLHHDTYENIAFSQGPVTARQRILNCLNAPFNAYHIFGDETVETVSECNNYYDDNGASEKCLAFRESPLLYVGNIVSDIQLISYELINNYGLSWNYCSAGAADMGALVDFALRGEPLEDLTPLLVGTHDPMIHPGKGVIGLRLNGVDNVEINGLHISNIHSSTDIGTLLGGSYENVVSQQAPYMNGFSMNMVNAFTATFSSNIVLSSVKIHHILSNTGLAYGLAVWFETDLQIFGTNGLSIHHVQAGSELTPSDEYTSDSYPNLQPEACAFRIYDNSIYSAAVAYDDDGSEEENVYIQCISGHTGCLMEDEAYSHIGTVQECDDEEEEKVLPVNIGGKHHNNYHVVNVILAFAVAISIIVILVVYSKIRSKSITKSLSIPTNAESTPLLKA